MFVKICGITSESDALLAVALGADAVGFVFAPSSRQVSPSAARDIARRLPPDILTVGVFRDEAPPRVVEIVNGSGLRAAQLHGSESRDQTAWVAERVPFTIKAFAAGDPRLDEADGYPVDAVLIDSHTPGSGEVFDWSVADSFPSRRRVILAGGLNPDNVGEAIERVRPWGVDVSTGVEARPGHKDPLKLRYFLGAAKQDPSRLEWGEDHEMGRADLDELVRELAHGPDVFDWEDDAALE